MAWNCYSSAAWRRDLFIDSNMWPLVERTLRVRRKQDVRPRPLPIPRIHTIPRAYTYVIHKWSQSTTYRAHSFRQNHSPQFGQHRIYTRIHILAFDCVFLLSIWRFMQNFTRWIMNNNHKTTHPRPVVGNPPMASPIPYSKANDSRKNVLPIFIVCTFCVFSMFSCYLDFVFSCNAVWGAYYWKVCACVCVQGREWAEWGWSGISMIHAALFGIAFNTDECKIRIIFTEDDDGVRDTPCTCYGFMFLLFLESRFTVVRVFLWM